MAISLASLQRAGTTQRPPLMLLYGTHGVGKTNLGAGAPNPVFVQTEDGLANQRFGDIPTFGMLKTYREVCEAIGSLLTEDHDFKTLVLDSLDHMEPLVWAETVARLGWRDIEHDAEGKSGYGRGYVAADGIWRELLDGLRALRNERGMAIVMLAHSEVKRVEPPETEPYDRYMVKLHKRAAALVQESTDAVLFVNYRVRIVKDTAKPGAKLGHARGVGAGERVVHCQEMPAHLAKNRYDMPDTITLPDDPMLAWQTVAAHIPFFAPA